MVEVFTIGYEGRSVDELIRELKERRIKVLVDIRAITSSRKKGFSKNQLDEELRKAGLVYLGMKELGTPDEVRRAYKAGGSIEELRRSYGAYLDAQGEKIEELKRHLRERRSALFCYEKDVKKCHRYVLAKRLEQDGFEIKNI